MDHYFLKVRHTSEYLAEKFKLKPAIGFLTGTGLGDAVSFLNVSDSIPYEEIPDFPVSTVSSHPGKLLFGAAAGHSVVVMQGRFHLYEGYSPKEITFPIRVMKAMGVAVLFLTNASGGVNDNYKAGDIMLIEDHINLTGENPLVGENEDSWGVRFPDMSRAYDEDLRKTARVAAKDEGVLLREGVYAGFKGPSLETPAEIRFLKTIGADSVGFSTVLECIAAVHAGMRVIALSMITNMHDPKNPEPADIESVISTARAGAPKLRRILERTVKTIQQC